MPDVFPLCLGKSFSWSFSFSFFLRGTIVFLRKREKRENIDFSISDFFHDNTHKTVDIGKLILFLIKINATDNTNSSYEQAILIILLKYKYLEGGIFNEFE